MTNMPLMQAMTDKMTWLEQNQKVLAQNIANADTPGYEPQELKPQDFKSLLESTTSHTSLNSANTPSVPTPLLVSTDPKHIGPATSAGADPKGANQKKVYETAPGGNAVILEEQLLKMNANFADHKLITNLYQKNIDMLKESVKSE